MKKNLSILLIFLTFFGTCQTSEIDKIDIIGKWKITDFYDSDKFEDIWEFKSDSIFNELKYKYDGDTTLAPDENGTWKLEGVKLKITVTGEDYRGVQKLYDKPEILEFEITIEGEDYILLIISNGLESKSKIPKLRLTRI